MSPKRPYLARALYEWLLDNELTPHVVIDASWPGTEVPQEFVQDGQIVLNIHPDATTAFQMGNVDIQFQARFGGVPRRIVVPYGALLAIYARENGAGSIFEPEAVYEDPTAELLPNAPQGNNLKSVDSLIDEPDQGGGDDDKPPPRGRPQLKVIK
ncbi:ClpXP protease specificity-enhancing factor [Aliidiomarina quisquiliarum]|uniref:ClpXP protease specificity-enhancing factor n=1 Tax=Aliidiomarina quisquiliarum TaxID=2938947 RepID=UPI00208F353F|nr:ClpXP protease specificity-enhancing factor [Aliidiomarina quisquiliarum]MCO4321448.1 ClpXP protease specificity-enhancing factor [Aliidiomarina quisquiliarum]